MSPAPAVDLDAWEAAEEAQLAPRWQEKLPQAAHAALEPTLTEWGSSRFSEHRRCARAHHLRYSEQIVPLRLGPSLGPDYLGLGILIHACLAYVWEGFKLGEQRAWRDVLHAATQREGGVAQATYEECERLLSAYWANWGTPDWEPGLVEIVDVEREFTEPAGGRFALPYTARLDLVVRIAGQIFVVDTKTRAQALPSNSAEYGRKLRTRPQFLGQSFLAQKAYGLEAPPHVLVNAIVKTKVPRFGRIAVPITAQDVANWVEWQATASLEGSRMNYSQCAPEIGSPCVYLEYCHGSDEQRARGFGPKV